MKNFFYYFIIAAILCSCTRQREESHLNSFDISPASQNIVFSYKKDSLYKVYIQNLKDEKLYLISQDSGNYINPKYNDDGNLIAFLHYPDKQLVPEFHIYDIVNQKISKKIKVNRGFVSDYTFFSDNKIFYLQAKSFDSYSPIAPKSHHDFDIYELDLITLKSKKVSNLNSYYMGEIIKWKNDILLVSIKGEPKDSGLFRFNLKSDVGSKLLEKIIIKNDTLRNSTMYDNPTILDSGNIICSSSYQMVNINMESKKEFLILPSTGYHYNAIRKRKNLIYYRQHDNTDNIYYFDLRDKKINVININIDNI